MQTIPKNPRMLGIAQALHWGGFGGSGAYLKPFMQMDPLMPHRIGYHGKETGGFNQRLQVILSQQMQMKSSLVDILPDLLTTCFPSSEKGVINILDVGSGPTYLGAKPVVDALIVLGHEVSLTASDVDEESLKSLLLEKNNSLVLKQVKYFDLSQIGIISESQIIYDYYNSFQGRLAVRSAGSCNF